MNKIKLRLGELFCGCGGITLGAINAKNEQYKIVHEWASDYNSSACETYIKNICPKFPNSVICSDVKDLDMSTFSNIDIFAYGFPCNDFSTAGPRKGKDGKYGMLYKYGIQVLKKFQPTIFFAENVSGLTHKNNANIFNQILTDFIKCGYNITPHLYKFEEYGIPQKRQRILIVGIRNDLNLRFKVPKCPKIDVKNLYPINVFKGIENCSYNNEKHFFDEKTKAYKRLQYIKEGQNLWDINDILPKEIQWRTDKKYKDTLMYRRTHSKEIPNTIVIGGGTTKHLHFKEDRILTCREIARIQTFPDNFIFYGKKDQQRSQIGMAVSPKMSQIIFEHILKIMNKEPYEWIPENINCNLLNYI